MSGIATSTNEYVRKLDGLNTRILDTRKTTPGFRFLEKEAVRIGGGNNHRMGLYDMIMLKDNHIDYAGGIEQAIGKTREYISKNKLNLKVEIEARSVDEIKIIMATGGVDRIMLDNFSVKNTLIAVKLIDGKYETESSGGINLETIRSYAECGVDFISVGALTHHVKSLDMSLKAI
jgi:nicotinate-nucleotide pyrophosphorylase (carboxylating)